LSRKRLKDRIALITGASLGLGRAVALAFAREGAHVLLLARTRQALEEVDDQVRAQGGAATLVPLDLANGKAIDALGPMLYERFGKLDVLVGNAAILGGLSPLPHIASANWDRVFAVNVTANWRLSRTLDPLLRRADAGRAIFVTSGVAQSCKAYWAPYSASKAALEGLAKTYRQRDRRYRHQSKPGGSRRHRHAHARRSLSRRGPQHATHARSGRRDLRPACHGGV
jgi:NAD(P)-dependent dehydrogenase (short-subunit alcohol dehydrogenase family)